VIFFFNKRAERVYKGMRGGWVDGLLLLFVDGLG